MAKQRYRATRKKNPTMADLTLEDNMEETLRQTAERFGWLRHHAHDSRRSESGLPDDTIVEYGQLIFWELKAEGKEPSDVQWKWLNALSQVKGPPLVEVIHPGDMDRCIALLQRRGR